MNSYFLSCDWGTTSFRLRLVEAGSLKVIAEERSGTGIAGTYQLWQKTSLPREDYFAAIINAQINVLSEKTGIPLQEVPVVLSGMASSSIGMVELPYKELPFNLSGADLAVHRYNRFIIISGVCSKDDVMRGEETKVVGCGLPDTTQEQWLLMPGTHPKHVVVNRGQVVRFQTFMTGEFFDLLSTHSILAASIGGDSALDCDGFIEGLHAGWAGNLLHTAFMVRTNQLLKKISPAHNRSYLSGLLIGAELKAVPLNIPVYVVAGPLHTPLYTLACQLLNIPVAAVIDADEALIRGQWAVIADL
ncbi:2-keto-3-deoxy-galactonokinase [Chitinophaga sp. SYP-B3965]|uniref:2-dehydro-3-deoxygalactonokinase n=1 Tax=Chitinophaga sp. SYP-B3965 TaxID=2663120 RepID=UPI0012995BB5|nr:2-dehydro-3-deoxygalactonokinase [Chitinophaga sp. SYP-B3965]MRG45284.1 2-keto-3-deoxy-galactonokinase [Chitinophaga sp. SYP-B3965]